jgi:hypothetical protein
MKKIIITTAIFFFTAQTFAQDLPALNKKVTSDDLFLKSKKQKTAAWICAAGGTVLFVTGALTGVEQAIDDINYLFDTQHEENDYTGSSILLIAGAAGIVASIPLFIASGSNKRRATLMMKNETVSLGLPKLPGKSITGITLSIPIGR